ncbi:hypothetical protein WN944_010639 [Citrus x changshan-huyou]|uniref:Uncharacterized protein n=1 Tax=Citrus x changshan-huyou TaxID=2935761 RepID=A0AAP0QXB0_9ROSI
MELKEMNEILSKNRVEDVDWLYSFSESELDMLISLKLLVLQRADVIGHEQLANKFDLKMLRAIDLYDPEDILDLIEGSESWLEKTIPYKKIRTETLVLQILALKLRKLAGNCGNEPAHAAASGQQHTLPGAEHTAAAAHQQQLQRASSSCSAQVAARMWAGGARVQAAGEAFWLASFRR